MSVEDYVQRALAARAEQGLPEAIEDPAALDFLAELLSTPTRHGRPVIAPGDRADHHRDRSPSRANDRPQA